MRRFFLLLFSFLCSDAFAASCCVSNTGFSNLMILPAKWQQTFSVSQSRVIGDVNTNGESLFRNNQNKDSVQSARMDLAYSWTNRYQTGVSLKYQNRTRDFYGESANDSGWSDVGLSHAYQAPDWRRIWFFQSLNIPTANSNFDSNETLAVDAHGTGTYQLSQGIVSITNLKEWDFLIGPEFHYNFARTFRQGGEEAKVMGSSGWSLILGTGYIPWRSRTRYGLSLNPRYEGSRRVKMNQIETKSDPSLVWDTSLNITHTINAEYSLGINYLDQTVMGPAKNTLLSRSISAVFQSRWQ